MLCLLRLAATHQTEEDAPSHTHQTSDQSPMLHGHECQVQQTDSRPQLLSCGYERPEAYFRLLPAVLPALPSQHSNPHDEKHRVYSGADCLVEQELHRSVLDAELFLHVLRVWRRVLRGRSRLFVASSKACLFSSRRLACDCLINQAFFLFRR